eukprot:1142299-Pleurochrysis_carterae.AAC.3
MQSPRPALRRAESVDELKLACNFPASAAAVGPVHWAIFWTGEWDRPSVTNPAAQRPVSRTLQMQMQFAKALSSPTLAISRANC